LLRLVDTFARRELRRSEFFCGEKLMPIQLHGCIMTLKRFRQTR
jgi:hypothetical protein